MAGFFGLFDFTKEGPGIDPDEPEKGPFLEFFSIVGTKFWKLITINLMMILFHLPALVLSFLVTNWLLPLVLPNFAYANILKVVKTLGESLAEGVTVEAYASHLFISTIMVFTFAYVGLQFFVLGPVHTGFTYLMRNFSRREPCFIWMDFRDTIKLNWKQGLVHSVISTLVYCLMAIAFHYYGVMLGGNTFSLLLRAILLVCMILFTMMQFYIYQLMITFDLKLKDIYRNALLFTFVRLPSNFGVLLLCVLILIVLPFLTVWLIPSALGTLIIFILYCVFLLSFTLLLINFQANRAIYKYMLKPLQDKEKAERQAAIMAEDEEALAEEEEDKSEQPEQDDKDEEDEEAPDAPDAKHGVPSGAPA